MAATGNLRAQVALLLKSDNGRVVVRPHLPLVLANKVANRKEHLGEASCITEMSVMMACWKQNDFSDAACAKEIAAFFTCTANAESERKARENQDGVAGQTGKLPAKQVNKLLQRFPNITHEI
ncbi:coiled-coil-helix-coiled-coil-helix domain-containing protein 1-like [Protopterus annectens]|uniref:coiled-coil-helix-coiled-coil-helix domain-containing protein 1-like n=1 Tax=Protopterus annectens TaxID=7888 RepID=UPI001CF9F072|nr:coiled-coil-helix-coiled-coil-helix domain-containing protein 1-like [Protopterus annectens]